MSKIQIKQHFLFEFKHNRNRIFTIQHFSCIILCRMVVCKMERKKVPNIVGVSLDKAKEILEKANIEIEKEKKKIDIFEKSGTVVKVEPKEETSLKKNEKVVLYVSDRKPILIIILLFLLCALLGRTSLGKTIIRGTEDKVIRVLNLSKPTAPEITGGSKEWAQSRVVKVKKDSYAKKGLAYYEYCVGTNLNKCVWKKTNTKNVRVSKTGKWKVVFRGVDKEGNTSSNSNIEEVYIDNSNPIINKVSIKNKKVKIEAIDKESGIKNYYYSIDGENYKETRKEFEIKDKIEKISIKVEDKAGNKTIVEVPIEKENEINSTSTTTKVTNEKTTEITTKSGGVTNPVTDTTTTTSKIDSTETTKKTSTTTTKKGFEYDIPKINLDKVPVEFVYGSEYELPSYVDFGNDEGTYKCVVEGKEETTTKNMAIGKHLIVCEATSKHNKRTMVEKEVEVKVKSGEEEIWDGWIRLNLNYPDNSTNWEWRIGKEGEIRDGYEYTGWQDYTGPILVKLDDVKDVYIRYDLLGETYIIAPNGKVAVDIEPEKYTLEGNEKTKVKIVYERNVETKEYRVAGGEWKEYTGEFEIGKNTLIEARGIRNEKIYDSDGNYLYTKKVTGTDSVFISEYIDGSTYNPSDGSHSGSSDGGYTGSFDYSPVQRPDGSYTTKPSEDVKPSEYLEGPIISANPSTTITENVKITITPKEEAYKIYYSLDAKTYKEYTGEFEITSNGWIRAYYIRKSDGKVSELSYYYIQNIKKASKPYVRIDATPDYLSEEVDKVAVKISGSNYTKLEYSLDGVIYEEYKGELTVEESQTIYAKGTNEFGETIESLDITTKTSPKEKENIEISIEVSPRKEEVEGLINKAKVKITYEKKATKRYYKLGYYGEWKEYTGEFEVTDNVTIYAYATGDNAVGNGRKSVEYLTTGIANPIISVEPYGKSQQVKVSIEYASTAEITRYKIGNGEYRDYNGSFYVYENETIYAYNKDELGNTGTSEYRIKNIVSAPNYVAIDKGKYYIIKLNYPETSSNREYKWKSDGVWKSYNGYGILLIKPEYKEEFKDIKDGIKVEDEYGKEIIFTDHYYFIDVPFSELMENLFMRWDMEKISAPKIIETPEEVTREASISIVYNKALVKKLYKIVYEDGEETEWLTYEKPFKIDKNKATIYAKGITRSESESKVGSKTITNIDNKDPEIRVKGNFEKAARQINVTVNAIDEFGIDKVKWAKGEQTKEYFKKNGNGIRNGSSFKVEENGKYTIYAVDYVGNEVIKVIEITNIDKEAPNIRINILTESYGTEAEIEIEYGDSVKKEYKIGKNGSYKEYTGTIKITSNEVLDFVNEDGSLTIYAKGTDEAGNEGEVSEDIYILDLDAPSTPEITAGAGYPILTEYGVKLGSKSYIKYDNRDDITNYYSIDNGATWKVYTGPFEITSGTIKAKSVKKESGLTIEATKKVDMPSDALGSEAYDSDTSTFVGDSSVNYKLLISPEMIGKRLKITWRGAYIGSSKASSMTFIGTNKNTFTGIAGTSIYTDIVEIPTGTTEIQFQLPYHYNNYPCGRIYEVSTYDIPVISNEKRYPILDEYEVKRGYNVVNINYFSTSVQRLYRINSGEWKEYQNKAIRLETGDILEAKGINRFGTETNISSYTSVLPSDALSSEAYDDDETTFVSAKDTSYYLEVSSNMVGKSLLFIGKAINQEYTPESLTFTMLGDNSVQLLTKQFSKTTAKYMDIVSIPSGTKRVKITFGQGRNRDTATAPAIYEIEAYDTPVLHNEKYYPILTEYGVNKGYNEITIDYFSTSVQRLYRINAGKWEKYNDKSIKIEIGDTIEAKGIDKNGVDTRISSYLAILPSDALGVDAYDGKNSTFVGDTTNIYKIKVSPEMIGQSLKIMWRGANIGGTLHSSELIFIGKTSNTITSTKGTTINTDRIEIPEGTTEIQFRLPYHYNNYPCGRIYEIGEYAAPVFLETKNYPMIKETGVSHGYNEISIKYFSTSVQRLYRINAGEWKEYNDKSIKIEIGDTIEAKGVDANNVETDISILTAVLKDDAIGSNAYDGNKNTYYEPPLSDINFAKMQIDESMIGKKIIVESQSNANLYRFYDKNLNQLGTQLSNVSVLIVPENAAWLYYGENRVAAHAYLYEIYPSTIPFVIEQDYYPTISKTGIAKSYIEAKITYLSYFAKKLYSLDNGTTWLDYKGIINIKAGDVIQAKAIDKDGKETEISTYTVKGLTDNLDDKAFDKDKTTSVTLSSRQTKSFILDGVDNEVLRIYTTGTVNAGAYIKFYDKDNQELSTVTLNTDLTTLVIPEGSVKASIYSGTSALTINEVNLREAKATKEKYPEITINDTNWTTTKTVEILYPEGTEREYSLDLGTTWNKYTNELTIDKETTIFARSIKEGKIISTNSFIITKVDSVEPTIELDIPEKIIEEKEYEIPTSVKFGASGGNVSCKSGGNEITTTKNLEIGEYKIICVATSNSGKVNTITKNINVIGKVDLSFESINGEQTFIAPISGTYKLEVWGASGGTVSQSYRGGYGAYSTGDIHIDENQVLYINIGGVGEVTSSATGQIAQGGYNGGGSGANYSLQAGRVAGGGGGATHIAFVSGKLASLEKYKGSLSNDGKYYVSNDIVIVSGGGGGSWYFSTDVNYHTVTPGDAGGIQASNSVAWTEQAYGYVYASGGTQIGTGTQYATVKGGFGEGASRTSYITAGGGGGFFGGNAGDLVGAGGSSYIANPLLTNKSMYCYNCQESSEKSTKTISTTCVNETPTENCAKIGNGYARITYIGE